MTIVACGINHKCAEITVRERIAVNMSAMYEVLHELLLHKNIHEAVVLSTCNRTEIITVTEDSHQLSSWLSNRYGLDQQVLDQLIYHHQGYAAVHHLMRVATGLDSMIVGEPQILGQVKKAYQAACDAGSVGQHLRQLFPAIFAAAKTVRQQSDVGRHATSLSFLVLKLAKQIFSSLNRCRVLFVGASETNALIAKYLQAQGIVQMTLANRSLQRAKHFSQSLNVRLISMPEIVSVLPYTDILVTATSSQLPILGKGAIETAQPMRKFRPLLVVDLGLPRNVEAEVAQLDNVYLYNMDDLQRIIQENQDAKLGAAEVAEKMLEAEAKSFIDAIQLTESASIVSGYRGQMQRIQEQELKKALSCVKQGEDPEQVMAKLSRSLMNKFLHHPTLMLRDAIQDQQTEKLNWFKDLFKL